MRHLFFLPLLMMTSFTPARRPVFIDPTGTYILKGDVKRNHVTTHSGELRIRLLDQRTVALCFYINKGYPGYESGSLLDTVAYNEDNFMYQPGNDSSCSIFFYFKRQSVEIVKFLSDPHSGCGFAPGVLIPAVFPKTSDNTPIIQPLGGHGN
jgi:hypothetical protein